MNARLPQTPIDAEQAIGQIAVQLPGSTAIFRRLKLDFCCGGQVSLRQSCAAKGLDLQTVVDELSILQNVNLFSKSMKKTGRIFLKMKLFGVLFVVTKPQQISGLLLSKLNMQKRKPSLLFKEKYTML